MSRYIDDEPDDYDMEGPRRAEEDYDRQADEEWYRELERKSRKRYGKESARRRKMFDLAYETLRVIQRIAGRPPASAVMVLGLNWSGQRSGWYVDIGGRLLMWDPRGGYRQEEYDQLPF